MKLSILNFTIPVRHQQRLHVNVWASIVGDCLIGPYVLPPRLTGDVYRNFLLNVVPELPEDIPLAIKITCDLCKMLLPHILPVLFHALLDNV